MEKKPSTDDLQLFTKWCPSPNEMTEAVVNKNIDRSLQRMKTNCLDLVQFHWWDYQDKEYITALKIMTKLQQQGKNQTPCINELQHGSFERNRC